MTFEELVQALQQWLSGMEAAVSGTNALAADDIQIRMPRSKDLIVTFPEDASASPEQMPAMVLEIEGSTAASIAPLKGALGASLYIADEAKTGSQARVKLVRWVDTVRRYCTGSTSIIGSNTRVVPRRESFVMGKAKGDLNGFQIKIDLAISF
jgi:hypothetical protein